MRARVAAEASWQRVSGWLSTRCPLPGSRGRAARPCAAAAYRSIHPRSSAAARPPLRLAALIAAATPWPARAPAAESWRGPCTRSRRPGRSSRHARSPASRWRARHSRRARNHYCHASRAVWDHDFARRRTTALQRSRRLRSCCRRSHRSVAFAARAARLTAHIRRWAAPAAARRKPVCQAAAATAVGRGRGRRWVGAACSPARRC
jgi:hypothetical protein